MGSALATACSHSQRDARVQLFAARAHSWLRSAAELRCARGWLCIWLKRCPLALLGIPLYPADPQIGNFSENNLALPDPQDGKIHKKLGTPTLQ